MILSALQTKIYLLTKTNSTSFTNDDMVVLMNNAYERVASLIMQSDGRWEWDDSNKTDFPIATTNLVSGQQDYQLSTAHLKIIRVELANSSGVFSKLEPYNAMIESESITYRSTLTGQPYEYDVLGASVILYPKPNYSYTAGLKVYFQRSPTLWSTSDLSTGTLEPGFNSLYHDLIALWTAYDYAIANGLNNANQLFAEIQRKEDALKKDYARRNPDERKIISNSKILYI